MAKMVNGTNLYYFSILNIDKTTSSKVILLIINDSGTVQKDQLLSLGKLNRYNFSLSWPNVRHRCNMAIQTGTSDPISFDIR